MNGDSAPTRKPRKKPSLEIHRRDGTPAAGVGPGVAFEFVKSYFPAAKERIRIASAYFSLRGYQLARGFIGEGVQLHVLVGREEGAALQRAVITEISDDLTRVDVDLWDAVSDLVERMEKNQFFIRDAREINVPFHCKFFIGDDNVLWHGSANYTKNGLSGNAEQASVCLDPEEIQTFTRWYDEVAAEGRDLLEPLRKRLEEWLSLAPPFDVYLAALYRLYGLSDLDAAPGALKPVYFQAAMVARALRQITEFKGALMVVATGLGKTVIGSETAQRLHHEGGGITRVILIAPKAVHRDWRAQLDPRRVPFVGFTPRSLFRQSAGAHHQSTALLNQLDFADDHTLIIVDEAHFARNQLVSERATERRSRVFRLLGGAVQKKGARILLLTATPYGTNPNNLWSLLYLLPDTYPHSLGVPTQWSAKHIDEFVRLEVVSLLGFPHLLKLARTRGDIDAAGRPYIQFDQEKRYLPRTLKLRRITYQPFLQPEMQTAFADGCFANSQSIWHPWADTETGEIRKVPTDPVKNTTVAAWLSSPPALRDTLERNLATPGDGEQLEVDELTNHGEFLPDEQFRLPLDLTDGGFPPDHKDTASDGNRAGYETFMRLSLEQRTERLVPIIERLHTLPPEDDNKLSELGKVIWRHCGLSRDKAIIFVRRPRTALYLETELRSTFGTIAIESTAVERNGKARLRNLAQRTAIQKRFSPRSHGLSDAAQPVSVLICTDADAEGVSLQDANVVINYDLPDGGDTLLQRAGRVLRPTTDAERDIYLYTFIPAWTKPDSFTSRLRNHVEATVRRLSRRHAYASSILRAGILPESSDEDQSFDIDIDTETFLREQEETGGWLEAKVPSPADHAPAFDANMARARDLRLPLHSARHYDGTVRRIVVFIHHGSLVVPMVFDLDCERLESRTDLEALELIACEEGEVRALFSVRDIESWAKKAVRTWCEDKGIDAGGVRMICAMYLHPRALDQGIGELLNLNTAGGSGHEDR